jgi:poly-gamma-glutamate synthesis protein (capsule biosynthesis protein)
MVSVDAVTPSVRVLTPPFPLRLWIGWRECETPVLTLLNVNRRLWDVVERAVAPGPRGAAPGFGTATFVGDIMLARRIETRWRRAGDADALYPFAAAAPLLASADFTMGNLECALSDRGAAMSGKDYTFRAAPPALERLKRAGIDAVTLANNHAMDFGPDALADTVLRLGAAGLRAVGGGATASAAAAPIFTRLSDGTVLGVLGYTLVRPAGFAAGKTRPGVNVFRSATFEAEVRDAKAHCDVLVVQLHWGEQYKAKPNERQIAAAHRAVDAGADLVIGHHPHWIQTVEFYKGAFIAYSLGNFVFDMTHRPKVQEGLMVRCWFRDKRVHHVALVPFRLENGAPAPLVGDDGPRGRVQILQEMFRDSGFLPEKV